MASRWAKLKGKYPPAPVADLESAGDRKFIEQVDERRFTYAGLSLPELMQLMVGFNAEWDEIKAREKELNIEYEAIGQLITKHFTELGVNSVKSDELGKTFYLNIEPTTTVVDNDAWEKFVDDHPELHYLWSINTQKRNTLVKALLDEGKDSEIPPMLSIFLKTTVRCVKA